MLSRWRLLYFLFPPGFSGHSRGADVDADVDVDVGGLCTVGCGEERGGEEDQETREGDETEEVRGDTWEELSSQLESGGLDPALDRGGEEERGRIMAG